MTDPTTLTTEQLLSRFDAGEITPDEAADLISRLRHAKTEGVKAFVATVHPSRDYEGSEIRTMAINYVRNNGGDVTGMSNGYYTL